MAKLQVSYEELIPDLFSNWKPKGESGNHHAYVTPYDGPLLLVVGSDSGKVVLGPRQTFVYEDGVVLQGTESGVFVDPIESLISTKEMRSEVLKPPTDNGLRWKEDQVLSRSDDSVDYNIKHLPPIVLGKARVHRGREEYYTSATGRRHLTRKNITEGGDALVLFSVRTWVEGGRKVQWRQVVAILVRPGVNRQRVADWLRHKLRFVPERRTSTT